MQIAIKVGDMVQFQRALSDGQKKILAPNIDKIAAEGVKFTSYYSEQTVCTPS